MHLANNTFSLIFFISVLFPLSGYENFLVDLETRVVGFTSLQS